MGGGEGSPRGEHHVGKPEDIAEDKERGDPARRYGEPLLLIEGDAYDANDGGERNACEDCQPSKGGDRAASAELPE